MPIERGGNALETRVLGGVGRFKCASNSPLCAEAERIPFALFLSLAPAVVCAASHLLFLFGSFIFPFGFPLISI